MTDLALWVNDAILLGTGILVWKYVKATNLLVQHSQQTLRQTQIMFEASQRPYVGVGRTDIRVTGGTDWNVELILKNFGNAPAVEVRLDWRVIVTGSLPRDMRPTEPVFVLQPRQEQTFRCSFSEAGSLNAECLQRKSVFQLTVELRFRSLSGQCYRYFERLQFDPQNQSVNVIETSSTDEAIPR